MLGYYDKCPIDLVKCRPEGKTRARFYARRLRAFLGDILATSSRIKWFHFGFINMVVPFWFYFSSSDAVATGFSLFHFRTIALGPML